MKPFSLKPRQLKEDIFLTDGGLETTLIYHQGIDLPHFAAFDLLSYEEGKAILKSYYLDYIRIARRYQLGFILESPTWRANTDWGYKLGYSPESLDTINRIAIEELLELKSAYQSETTKMLISGCVGPRGDGYSPVNKMGITEAEIYHTPQIRTFSEAKADISSLEAKRRGLITSPLCCFIPVSPFRPVPLNRLIMNVSTLSLRLCATATESKPSCCSRDLNQS